MQLNQNNSLASLNANPNSNTGSNANGTVRTDSFQNMQADLTREQWNDYKNRFIPIQNELIDLSQNDTLLNQQLERNEENIDNSFRLSDLNNSVKRGRIGIDTAKTEQGDNNSSLSKSLATASLNNETRQANEDLQTKIITGQGGSTVSLT